MRPAVAAGPYTELWLADLDETAAALLACEQQAPRLSRDEEERAVRIVDANGQRYRRATYIAQRLVLERMFGPALRGVSLPRDPSGRPMLPPSQDWQGAISLAHTRRWVLIGCTIAKPADPVPRIGVDLETPRLILTDAHRRAIIEAAAAHLSDALLPADDEPRFLQAWVRLEALAKADGRGIGHLLDLIGAIGSTRAKGVHDALVHACRALADAQSCQIVDLDVGPDLFAAAAITSGIPTPCVKRLSINVEATIDNLTIC